MNKATDLYNTFFKIVKDKDMAKECVTAFIEEVELLVSFEMKDHSPAWWAYRLNEIREDLQEL